MRVKTEGMGEWEEGPIIEVLCLKKTSKVIIFGNYSIIESLLIVLDGCKFDDMTTLFECTCPDHMELADDATTCLPKVHVKNTLATESLLSFAIDQPFPHLKGTI